MLSEGDEDKVDMGESQGHAWYLHKLTLSGTVAMQESPTYCLPTFKLIRSIARSTVWISAMVDDQHRSHGREE